MLPSDDIVSTNKTVQSWVIALDHVHCTWSDVNYTDKGRAEWQTATHMDRVHTMSQLWAALMERGYESPILLNVTLCALQAWVTNDWQNPNWFVLDVLRKLHRHLSHIFFTANVQVVE